MLPRPTCLRVALALLLVCGGLAVADGAGPAPSPNPSPSPSPSSSPAPAPPPVLPPTGLPIVTTGAVSQLAATSAQLTGRINPAGSDTTYVFNYGPTASYGSSTVSALVPAGAPASVHAKVDTLTTGTLYHYQLVATNSTGTTAGADQTFTPTAGLSKPTAVTGTPTATDGASATVTGTLNPNGQTATYRFNYGTTTGYGLTTPNQPVPAGTADVPVTAILLGLTPGLTYHYRLVATGLAGTTVGSDQVFVAGQLPVPPPTPVPPTVTTGPAADVTAVGASLAGTLNPQGQATNYAFQYGTTTDYGAATPTVNVGPGSVDQPVTGVLTGLVAGTTYHVRLTATNGAGSVVGDDQVFTTLPPPPPPPPPTPTPTPTPTPAPLQPGGQATPTPQAPPVAGGASLPAGAGLPQQPAAGPTTGVKPDAPTPVVTNLRLRPAALKAAAARCSARKGVCIRAASTRVTFWLSIPASVTLTVATARSKAIPCTTPHTPRCGPPPPARILRRFILTGYAGPNAAIIPLRTRVRLLGPGRYTVTALAQSAGVTSHTERALLRLQAED